MANYFLPCVKKKHTAKYISTVCYIFTVCIHGKEVVRRLPDKKHTTNYRAHGKKPVFGSVCCVRRQGRHRELAPSSLRPYLSARLPWVFWSPLKFLLAPPLVTGWEVRPFFFLSHIFNSVGRKAPSISGSVFPGYAN